MTASPCFIANKAINSNNERFSGDNLRLNLNSITLINRRRKCCLTRFLFSGPRHN